MISSNYLFRDIILVPVLEVGVEYFNIIFKIKLRIK